MRIGALLILALAAVQAPAAEWVKLPSLPDKEGVAAPFAGVSNGALLVAGGANFPDKKPWDGGKKVWYDTVFVLDKPDGKWQTAGKLPRPLAYGVSVTHGNGIICAGGSDADRHYPDCFRLEWRDGKLHTTKLPPLPLPLANACGALVGDTFYLAGGQDKPDATVASKSVWTIDLAAKVPKWTERDPLPARGRILAVAASYDGAFWVIGGADLAADKYNKVIRTYLKDAYRYDPGKGWKRVADLPHAVVAAPSPAPELTVLGGDDEAQVGADPAKHNGFSKKILRYDLKTAKWLDAGELPAPRVTVPCVRWHDAWVVPSGERQPGVRSPEVWQWTPKPKP